MLLFCGALTRVLGMLDGIAKRGANGNVFKSKYLGNIGNIGNNRLKTIT